MSRIVVVLECGLVQEVYHLGDGPVVDAVTVDRDTEGAEEEDLTFALMPGDDPKDDPYAAYVHYVDVLGDDTYSGTTVEALVEEFEKREEAGS